MHVRLTFHQMSDERLLVLTEVPTRTHAEPLSPSLCATTAFDHEDVFLRRVIAAELDEASTRELIATVILTVSQPARAKSWLELDLDQLDILALGLNEAAQAGPKPASLPFPFAENMMEFHQFLMQAPTPFVMLSGPEHHFTFINQPYVDLIGQTSKEEILGRPVRAVLPELEGQPFFHLLDEVFRTQKAFVGIEVPARLRRPQGEGYDERHFDFIYHPVIGPDGGTLGIMVQATDVTEKVLAHEVSDKREQQMFRQWEELDAIYRTSPAAMALFCSIELTILRVNDRQAEWMGSPVSELVGRRITSLPFHSPLYVSLLRRAAAGEEFRDYLFHDSFCAEVVPARTFRINLTPFRNPAGEIEAITSMAIEVTGPEAESPHACVHAQPEPVV